MVGEFLHLSERAEGEARHCQLRSLRGLGVWVRPQLCANERNTNYNLHLLDSQTSSKDGGSEDLLDSKEVDVFSEAERVPACWPREGNMLGGGPSDIGATLRHLAAG